MSSVKAPFRWRAGSRPPQRAAAGVRTSHYVRWKPSTARSPRANAAETFLPFLAVERLVRHAGEPSLFVYWRAYAEDPYYWRHAFETAFGLTPEAFYAAFERYRATLR